MNVIGVQSWWRSRSLRKRCEERLTGLRIPIPFDATLFCEALAVRRARPILLHAVVTHGNPYGLWARGADVDHIFYDGDSSALHQQHIILHEACHILCDHQPLLGELPVGMGFVLNIHRARELMFRSENSTDEEQEAELMASLILQHANDNLVSDGASLDPSAQDLLRRIELSLER